MVGGGVSRGCQDPFTEHCHCPTAHKCPTTPNPHTGNSCKPFHWGRCFRNQQPLERISAPLHHLPLLSSIPSPHTPNCSLAGEHRRQKKGTNPSSQFMEGHAHLSPRSLLSFPSLSFRARCAHFPLRRHNVLDKEKQSSLRSTFLCVSA